MPRSIGENVRYLAAPLQWCEEFLATEHIYAFKNLKQLIILDDELTFEAWEAYFNLSTIPLERRIVSLVFRLVRLALEKPEWTRPVLMMAPAKANLEAVTRKTTFHCLLRSANEDEKIEDIPFVEILVFSHLVLYWPYALTLAP